MSLSLFYDLEFGSQRVNILAMLTWLLNDDVLKNIF